MEKQTGSKVGASSYLDPFVDQKPEHDLFRQWYLGNEEAFLAYNEELKSYGEEWPPFLYKSADKHILTILELYKAKGVEKPASTFLTVMKLVKENIKRKHPFVDILHERMEDTMRVLNFFKETKDKEAAQILKDRGWM